MSMFITYCTKNEKGTEYKYTVGPIDGIREAVRTCYKYFVKENGKAYNFKTFFSGGNELGYKPTLDEMFTKKNYKKYLDYYLRDVV